MHTCTHTHNLNTQIRSFLCNLVELFIKSAKLYYTKKANGVKGAMSIESDAKRFCRECKLLFGAEQELKAQQDKK